MVKAFMLGERTGYNGRSNFKKKKIKCTKFNIICRLSRGLLAPMFSKCYRLVISKEPECSIGEQEVCFFLFAVFICRFQKSLLDMYFVRIFKLQVLSIVRVNYSCPFILNPSSSYELCSEMGVKKSMC